MRDAVRLLRRWCLRALDETDGKSFICRAMRSGSQRTAAGGAPLRGGPARGLRNDCPPQLRELLQSTLNRQSMVVVPEPAVKGGGAFVA
jgi:hypothetical protein